MHYFYILYSTESDKFYIGETHDLKSRIEKHNEHSYQKSFTKIAEDWQIVLCLECTDKQQALYLEKFVKRMKSRKFIQKTIDTPEILQDIIINKK